MTDSSSYIDTKIEYATFKKPDWAPPPSVYGKVWGILYVFITIVNIWLGINTFNGSIPSDVMVVSILNILANLSYMPLTFGNESWNMASFSILLTLFTLVYMYTRLISLESPMWVIALLTPYLIWMIIATILHFTIGGMNGKFT